MIIIVLSLSILFLSCSSEKDLPQKDPIKCDLNFDGEISAAEKMKCISDLNKNSEIEPDKVIDTTSDKDLYEGTVVHVGVHTEIQEDPTSLDYPEKYWPSLLSIVELADDYGVKLTIKFIPQTAEYILQDNEKLSIVRNWEKYGHELGFHHHGLSHKYWDGYTNAYNEIPKKSLSKYLGTMDDAINIVNQLPISGEVLTAGITDEETDWVEGILYETEGFSDSDSSLLSEPHITSEGSIELYSRPYATGKAPDVNLEDIEKSLLDVPEGYYLGITINDDGYDEHKGEVEDLFKFIQENNIKTNTIKETLSSYSS